MKICGSSGFKLVSPKGVPTFYPPRGDGKGTTIDLSWANFTLSRKIHRCEVASDMFGSDHQAIIIILNLSPRSPLPYGNSPSLTKLDTFSFLTDIKRELGVGVGALNTTEDVNVQVRHPTSILTQAFHKQGKMVPANPSRQKLWWDRDHLGPIVHQQKQARRWMLVSKLPHARTCYLEWQVFF